MNIALIVLPSPGKALVPPLTLAYLATLLEQRRHIVRIYDLALDPDTALTKAIQPLRSFRPQVVVVAGEQADMLSAAVNALHEDQHQYVLPVQMNRSGLDANHICSGVLRWIDRQRVVDGGKTSYSDSREPCLAIDQLPFPARHLLSLESYEMRAVGGELQTTLLIGGLDPSGNGQIVLRSPTQIVAELRSVSSEFGLRHFLFIDVPVTFDRSWLVELLTRLVDVGLNIGWEARADVELLDESLVAHMVRSGCEALTFELEAASVFESTATRNRLREAVAKAREQGIFVRANVKIEPPYESVPRLVDVAATFGLDDVRFDVVNSEAVNAGPDGTQLKEIARQIYDAGRDRQRIINRWGPALGNLIWKLRGKSGPSPDLDDEGAAA